MYIMELTTNIAFLSSCSYIQCIITSFIKLLIFERPWTYGKKLTTFQIYIIDMFKYNHKTFDYACQRFVCPNVISMTMNVIIQECIIESCFIEPYV